MLDTNTLIDLFSRRQPFFEDCERLMVMRIFGDVELWASAKSYTDVFCVLRKALGSADVQKMFLKSMEYMNVCSIDGSDIARAASMGWPDFEDCLVYVAADKIKADCILTRDEAGFSAAKIPACSATEFFEEYGKAKGVFYDAVDLNGV
ncbi:MAG: PIN domain-containing protein [Slackia sp.]|nr:PIN domain-containing protein [Slackia sp.]